MTGRGRMGPYETSCDVCLVEANEVGQSPGTRHLKDRPDASTYVHEHRTDLGGQDRRGERVSLGELASRA